MQGGASGGLLGQGKRCAIADKALRKCSRERNPGGVRLGKLWRLALWTMPHSGLRAKRIHSLRSCHIPGSLRMCCQSSTWAEAYGLPGTKSLAEWVLNSLSQLVTHGIVFLKRRLGRREWVGKLPPFPAGYSQTFPIPAFSSTSPSRCSCAKLLCLMAGHQALCRLAACREKPSKSRCICFEARFNVHRRMMQNV